MTEEDLEDYRSIILVLDSWQHIREKPGFEEEFATKLILNLFALEPGAKQIFGYTNVKFNPTLRNLKKTGNLQHMIRQIEMFEKAINLTGPPESLYMTLENLGRRHAKYGVPPDYVRKMGQAFIFSVKQHFGKDQWTIGLQSAWDEVYSIITEKMILGIESVESK